MDLARREHSGGQNHQDESEEKQLLNILESQPSIDISVNVQKSIPTVRVPHVQHEDKPPMRTVQKAEEESYSIFDWDS